MCDKMLIMSIVSGEIEGREAFVVVASMEEEKWVTTVGNDLATMMKNALHSYKALHKLFPTGIIIIRSYM